MSEPVPSYNNPDWLAKAAMYASTLGAPGCAYNISYYETVTKAKITVVGGCSITEVAGGNSSMTLGLKSDWIVGASTKIGLAYDFTLLPSKGEIILGAKYEKCASKSSEIGIGSLNFITLGLYGVAKKASYVKTEKDAATKKDATAKEQRDTAELVSNIAKSTVKIASQKKLVAQYEQEVLNLKKTVGQHIESVDRQAIRAQIQQFEAAISEVTTQMQTNKSNIIQYKSKLIKENDLTLLGV